MARRGDPVNATADASVHVGIVELGEFCARQRAHCLVLFELTGSWVASTPDPTQQRRFATATHRHAWHAELWAERCPAIPPVELDALVADHQAATPFVGADARARAYDQLLADIAGELDEIERRLDPVLDPSTARTIDLVRRDLTELGAETTQS